MNSAPWSEAPSTQASSSSLPYPTGAWKGSQGSPYLVLLTFFVPDRYSLNKPLDHSVLSWHLLLGEPELTQRVTHGLSGAASCWATHQAGLGKQDLSREPQASHSSLSKEAQIRPLDFISLIWLEAWQSRLDFLMSHIICGIKNAVLAGRERKILVTSAA